MDEDFYSQILDPLDTPGEKVAFYLALHLAMRSPALSALIASEMERRWRYMTNDKSIHSIEKYVQDAVETLVQMYRAKLQ